LNIVVIYHHITTILALISHAAAPDILSSLLLKTAAHVPSLAFFWCVAGGMLGAACVNKWAGVLGGSFACDNNCPSNFLDHNIIMFHIK
ncbi:hypothetical protein, partial [Helicobacter baculiformis]|uniref:hypothetical protein n=1 Tax=Helicobacter baculiformis TaxID=427351 RepID=UPI001F2ADE45